MLTLHRKGSFILRGGGDNKCGYHTATEMTYRYRVSITVKDGHLDDRGFIVDNNDIDRYFQNFQHGLKDDLGVGTKVIPSCEQMVLRAFTDLYVLPKGAVFPVKMSITIAGSPDAAVTHTWELGK